MVSLSAVNNSIPKGGLASGLACNLSLATMVTFIEQVYRIFICH
jgi:hypothetical protein